MDRKTALVKDFANFAAGRFERGELRPVIDSVFPLSQARQAHELMESNRTTGKIILKVDGA